MLRLPTKQVPFAKPFTKKREVTVHYAESVHLSGTYWDGGSRTSYALRTIQGQPKPLNYSTAPAHFGGTETTVTLEPGDVLVQTGTFMGKPAACRLYARAAELVKLLGLNQDFQPGTPDAIILDWLYDQGFDVRGSY